jgi:hypothetical protein
VPVTVVRPERPPERVGQDVRTLQYVDLEAQRERFFTFVRGLRHPQERLEELDVPPELRELVLALFDPEQFERRSRELNSETWVPLLDQLARGYIRRNYHVVYHDVIFACWQLRALAFAHHEAASFEQAEEATERQAQFAYEYGERYRGSR